MSITPDTLRAMQHETLVGLVRARVTGTRQAHVAQDASTPDEADDVSHYARYTGVPAAMIHPYPKRRPAVRVTSSTRMTMIKLPDASERSDFRYEDFFATTAEQDRASA